MHEHATVLNAPSDRPLYVWFEPWAEGLQAPAGASIELRAISSVEGRLEIESTAEQPVVYRWSRSTLEVALDGQIVKSFDQPVPDMSQGLTTREFVTLVFGQPPTP